MGLKSLKQVSLNNIGNNQQANRTQVLSMLSACRYFFSDSGLIMGIRNSDSSEIICETNLMQKL